MAKDTTPTPQDEPKTKVDLMAKMGIQANQVQINEKVSKTTEINTNADKLKVGLKDSTQGVNKSNGENISFRTIKRDGHLKDAEGKPILDENNKKTPRYVETRVQGYFVVDETEDGFYKVTRGVHYTESHLCSEFVKLDD
tara:strand:- start:332 stop:751 length:420 start_codon:yes stop_codon:yes gene_type:complete